MPRNEVRYLPKKHRASCVREEAFGTQTITPPPRKAQSVPFALAAPVISDDAHDHKNGGVADSPVLREIDALTCDLERRWRHKIVVANELTRSLVSFQANKSRAVYRWYKYKEGFSAKLVEHFLNRFHLSSGVLLDPFAGSGTALFAAGAMGMKAEGIELLPIGQVIIETKQMIDLELRPPDIEMLTRWKIRQPWQHSKECRPINELRITKGAYPPATVEAIGRYLAASDHENDVVKAILRFALLCVLESVSYTRKDGQYLRWDHRSGRRLGKKIFDKGRIQTFDEAIKDKLGEIVDDLGAATIPDD